MVSETKLLSCSVQLKRVRRLKGMIELQSSEVREEEYGLGEGAQKD